MASWSRRSGAITRIDKVQIDYGLVLERSPDGYWKLSAGAIASALAFGAAPMVLNFPEYQGVKALLAGGNITLVDSGFGVVMVGVTAQEVSPGFGNHHVVNGTPLKSYPLVAGANVSISTRLDADGDKQDVYVEALQNGGFTVAPFEVSGQL